MISHTNWNDGSEKYNLEHKLKLAESENARLRAEVQRSRDLTQGQFYRLSNDEWFVLFIRV